MQENKSKYLLKGDDNSINFFLKRSIELEGKFLLPHLRDGMKVLDLGCGPGGIACGIAKRVSPSGSVVGLDIDPQSLAAATTRAKELGLENVEFVQANAEQLPFEDETFDVVFTSAFICHINHIKDKVITEVKRVLKKGGIFATREPNVSGMFFWPEFPSLHKIMMSISKGGAAGSPGERNLHIGKEMKTILFYNGFKIFHQEVHAECEEADISLGLLAKMAKYENVEPNTMGLQEFAELKEVYKIEEGIFFSEASRTAVLPWICVLAKKP
jgi:ubiquinone/menaquinone biosynthesis C-methylase UbiE